MTVFSTKEGIVMQYNVFLETAKAHNFYFISNFKIFMG